MLKKQYKLFTIMTVCSLLSCSCLNATMTYETYLESWDGTYPNGWYSALTGLPGTDGTKYNNIIVVVSFADYTFPGSGEPSGLSFTNGNTDLTTLVTYVHSQGGKVKLAFGGALDGNSPTFYIQNTSYWPNGGATAASAIAAIVSQYHLDGIDIDLEERLIGSNTTGQMVALMMAFFTQLRTLLPNTNISLTIPAQAWGTGTYWLPLMQALAPNGVSNGLVNYINFMEYDINFCTGADYPTQIQSDIDTYTSPTTSDLPPNWSPGFNIPASFIQIGLMPGNDDNQNNLTVPNTIAVVDLVTSNKLYPGIFVWSLNRDAQTDQTPLPFNPDQAAPYAYSEAILEAFNNPPSTFNPHQHKQQNKRYRQTNPEPYTPQPVPPHGAIPHT